jgi:hypothetical protein
VGCLLHRQSSSIGKKSITVCCGAFLPCRACYCCSCPTWPPSSIVMTVCGFHAAIDEEASVARFGRLDSSSSGNYSCACSVDSSLVHSELSWWRLKSSLHLHVAHTHYGSHDSSRYCMKRYTWLALAG